jgi:hypothetical protein
LGSGPEGKEKPRHHGVSGMPVKRIHLKGDRCIGLAAEMQVGRPGRIDRSDR